MVAKRTSAQQASKWSNHDHTQTLTTVSAVDDITKWCHSNMETMHNVFKWGGLLIIGGPDEHGNARTFM